MKFTSLLDSLEQIQQPSLLQSFAFHLEFPVVVMLMHTFIQHLKNKQLFIHPLHGYYQFMNETTDLSS